MNWETTDDGQQRCPTHGHTFGALEYCPACPIGGGEVADVTRPSEAVARADEDLCRVVRDEILVVARQLQEQRDDREAIDRVGYSTVAKLYDTALKWHRAATDERARRGDREFATWLVEEKRRLLDRGASH